MLLALCFFFVYRKKSIPYLLKFGENIKDLGFGGFVIVALCVFVTCFPPIPGYGILTALSGVIYGWLGFVPVFIGAFLGGVVCFGLFRRFGFDYAQRLVEANPKVSAVVRAAEGEGFKLVFFVRLAPYPYNLLNSVFGASRVPFWHFALATFVTLPKVLVDIGFGANLAVISDSLLDHPTVLHWVIFVVLGSIAVGVMLWVVWIGRRAIRRMEQERERLRQLGQEEEESSAEEEVAIP